MNKNYESDKGERTQGTRREVITGNLKAAGLIAAAAVIARVTPASAKCHLNPQDNEVGDCCFLRGAKIQTVDGERRVEDLAIGDLLPTVFGGVRPIQWIARYSRKRGDSGKPWVKAARPVRIQRSALAPNVPHRDLYVTAGHALYLDDILVTAGALVNGTSIAYYAAAEFAELQYFNVKTETHDVLFAEGAPCETLLSVTETASNFADYYRRYGAPTTPDRYCAPVFGNGGRSEIKMRLRDAMSPWLGPHRVELIRQRLAARAETLINESVLIS
jgi:hypothetical protein